MSNYSGNSLTQDSNHVWSMLLDMVPHNTTILDIGCSSGNFGRQLIEKKGCTVDGLELDEGDFKKAQKNLRQVWNLNVEQDSLAAIRTTYDVVILADVIEHLVDPARALNRVKKLVKPGGSIIFSVPNMAHISVRLNLLAGSFSYTETGLLDKTHLHYYDSEELARVFEAAGMYIEKIDYPQIRYPRTLIDQKLAELGLKPTDTFYKQLDRPEYYAYQFIGMAKYQTAGSPKSAKLREKQAIQNDFAQLADEIEQRKQLEKTLRSDIKAHQHQIDTLNDQLQAILQSKSYKLAQRLAKAKSYTKRNNR